MSKSNLKFFEPAAVEKISTPENQEHRNVTRDSESKALKKLSFSNKELSEGLQNFISIHSSDDVVNTQFSDKNLLRNRLSSQFALDDYSTSLFCDVDLAFPTEFAVIKASFLEDKYPCKINVAKEEYCGEDEQPWVLPVVKYVQGQIAGDPLLFHEYLPVLGLTSFCEAAMEFCLGKDNAVFVENRAGAVQALGRTGALRLAAEFLFRFYNKREEKTTVYFPEPTWKNHIEIFKSAGFTDLRRYRYWNMESKSLDSAGMACDLNDAPKFSIVLFHACAHNPTGFDPNWEEWELLSKICTERRLFPVFDCAYQGFASGNPNIDNWSIRHFIEKEFEMIIAQSFEKPFGLYDEKVGNVIMILRDSMTKMKCYSQFQEIITAMYSNPPCHGARIVAAILRNPALYREWIEDLSTMIDRIYKMRDILHCKLRVTGTPGSLNHIVNQCGMFCYTGLTPEQVNYMKNKKHIYMLSSGMINISCLTEDNVEYFAESFDEAVRLS